MHKAPYMHSLTEQIISIFEHVWTAWKDTAVQNLHVIQCSLTKQIPNPVCYSLSKKQNILT